MSPRVQVDPRAGVVRGVRAAVLTAPAVGLAASAHGLADGCASPVAVVLALGLCWPAAVAVLGARRRTAALLLWVLTAQAVTHGVLDALCGSGLHLPSASPSMALAHAGSAALTAVLVARADAGLWTAHLILGAVRKTFRQVRAPQPPLPARPRRTSPRPFLLPRSSWVAAQPARRGPPALLAPALQP